MQWDLDYWNSDDWKTVSERLDKLEKDNVIINPVRHRMFSALEHVSLRNTRVCLIGQDPYPDPRFATGVAFSIPERYTASEYPQTLRQIFNEYCSDLYRKFPSKGNLSKWEQQGVLLWNAIPTCECGRSLSHDWPEYHNLTKEIVEKLSERGIVFGFLGGISRRFIEYVNLENNSIVVTSHPSPRGFANSKTPFKGSRFFSTLNDKLVEQGMESIEWTLE